MIAIVAACFLPTEAVLSMLLADLQSAQKEISLWFKSEELADYNVMTKAAIYE